MSLQCLLKLSAAVSKHFSSSEMIVIITIDDDQPWFI